jgi:hypothetical protein
VSQKDTILCSTNPDGRLWHGGLHQHPPTLGNLFMGAAGDPVSRSNRVSPAAYNFLTLA